MPSHFVYCDEWFDSNSNLFKMFLKMVLKTEFRKRKENLKIKEFKKL